MNREFTAASERRRFHRLRVRMAVEYSILSPETEEFLPGLGVLRDISLSGVYFHCHPQVSLKPGQIVTLSIAASVPEVDLYETSHIDVQGEVVRLEPPREADSPCGVAIRFLTPPVFRRSPALG